MIGNITQVHDWEQEKFVEQMESWLDFVWANLKNVKYRTYQGERYSGNDKSIIGRRNKCNNKRGLKSAFNTWAIFNDWKSQQKIAHKSFLSYEQAVNEMNIFLDFMQDNYLDFVEY